jgi:hypothetical protein
VAAKVGGRFAASVAGFGARAQQRATAILRESAQRLIEEAQTPVGKGGKMRVDTNFLRASGQASLTGMPYGPSIRGAEPNGNFDYTFVLAQAQLGGTIWFGWTANYAIYREFHDGFMRSAAQNWQAIVNQVAREVAR